MRRATLELLATVNPSYQGPMEKADGFSVDSMVHFRPDLFGAGDAVLPLSKLKPAGFLEAHRRFCQRCTAQPDAGCPFWGLLRCVTHGWEPALVEGLPPIAYTKNHGSFVAYEAQVLATVDRWLADGIVVPTTLEEVRAASGREPYINPLGAVVKESDLRRSVVYTGITADNATSLARANAALQALHEAGEFEKPIKLKPRIITDMKASRANTNVAAPPFRTPKLDDALELVTRGAYLGIVDVEEYFPSFPLSSRLAFLFCIVVRSALLRFTRCNFGFALAPYFCDTFSALLLAWVTVQIGRAFVMCDDWFVASPTEAGTREKLEVIKATGGLCGFTFASAKERVGQQEVLLGVLINSVSMTLSFDPSQAKTIRLQLSRALAELQQGKRGPSYGEQRSIAGQLGWYAQTLQAGRTRIQSWRLYMRHGAALSQPRKLMLYEDLKWWIDVLTSWENSDLTGLEYPILNSTELLGDATRVQALQSDASGPDGFGYYWGRLDDPNPSYYSQVWDESHSFGTSHHGELEALLHFCRSDDLAPGTLLLWTTDCQASVWSINKGRCKEELSLPLLRELLELCDNARVVLVALWVPRDSNLLADSLSHYAHSLGRHHASGKLRAGGHL